MHEQIDVSGQMGVQQMMRRCAWIIATMASFYSNGAIGEGRVGMSQESDFGQKGPAALSNAAEMKNLDAKPAAGRQPAAGEFLLARFPPRETGRSFRRPGARPHRRHRSHRSLKLRRPRLPDRSNRLSHSSEPRSVSRKMSCSFSTKRRKASFASMSAKRFWAGICA